MNGKDRTRGDLKGKERTLGQRPWLQSAEGTPMPELVLETKQEKNGEEKGTSARVYVLYVYVPSWG